MYKVVPGHKGVVVGDHKYMIERTVRQSLPKLHTKTAWDPQTFSTVTKHYLPDEKPYNAMTDGPHLLIEETQQ